MPIFTIRLANWDLKMTKTMISFERDKHLVLNTLKKTLFLAIVHWEFFRQILYHSVQTKLVLYINLAPFNLNIFLYASHAPFRPNKACLMCCTFHCKQSLSYMQVMHHSDQSLSYVLHHSHQTKLVLCANIALFKPYLIIIFSDCFSLCTVCQTSFNILKTLLSIGFYQENIRSSENLANSCYKIPK